MTEKELRSFVEKCLELRGGSPNAFYAHVDEFCKKASPKREYVAVENPDFSESSDFPWIVMRPSAGVFDANVFASRMSEVNAKWLAHKLNHTIGRFL